MRFLAFVVALCACVAGGTVDIAVRHHSSHSSLLGGDSAAAVSAARRDVQTILSYDYRSLSSDIASAEQVETGLLARQYRSSAGQLLSQATQLKAIVQATVGSAGVVSADGSDVVVLLFVDQATVRQDPGQTTPTTRIDQSRVQVTMTKVGSSWLVSSLAAL